MKKKRQFLKPYEEMRREYMRILLESTTAMNVTILEDVRAQYINPSAGISGRLWRPLGDIEVSEYMRDFLQHCGDFWEGYAYSFMIYNTLDVLFPRLSYRTKMAAALGVSNLFIAAYESGMLGGKSPDYLDIPAGIAGSLLYLGVNAVGKYMSGRFRRSERLL